MPEWLNAAEAAAYLKIDRRTLLEWARRGQVRGYKLSGTRRHVWRFLAADLDESLGFVVQSEGHLAVLQQ